CLSLCVGPTTHVLCLSPQGDSGGPLVCPLEGVWYLFGLSSWSHICQPPVGPSVFTNISYFAGWIKKHMKENPAPDPGKAPPEEKAPALSTDVSSETVLKPGMTVLLSAQFLLLWLSLVSAQ
ncbi:hypothetical protein H1C71_019966, partial [Ictidomys tridecemlineatus]